MIELRKATPKAIRYACLHFHYAKSVPSVQYGYNVYQDGEWCGVILYGSGATPNIASPFGMIQGEVLELVRVALNGKQNTTSECVAASLRKLHEDAPQIKIVVSFADEDQNHVGTIYQATNWIYLGRYNKGERAAFIINGKKTHPRTIGSAGGGSIYKMDSGKLRPGSKRVFHKRKRKIHFRIQQTTAAGMVETSTTIPQKGG